MSPTQPASRCSLLGATWTRGDLAKWQVSAHSPPATPRPLFLPCWRAGRPGVCARTTRDGDGESASEQTSTGFALRAKHGAVTWIMDSGRRVSMALTLKWITIYRTNTTDKQG